MFRPDVLIHPCFRYVFFNPPKYKTPSISQGKQRPTRTSISPSCCSPSAHLEKGSFCGFYDLMTPVGSDQGAEMNVASCLNPWFPFSFSALLRLASRWGWSLIFPKAFESLACFEMGRWSPAGLRPGGTWGDNGLTDSVKISHKEMLQITNRVSVLG